jgi:hypothetical protein
VAKPVAAEVSFLFDYSVVDAGVRDEVQQNIQAIHGLTKTAAKAVIEIGKRLIAIKTKLEHGQFLPCIKAEFGWSDRMAQRFMAVAEAFKSDNLSDLSFAPSALYALAAPSVPDDVRQEAITLAANGQTVTHATAKKIIEQHKESAPPIRKPLLDQPDLWSDDDQEEQEEIEATDPDEENREDDPDDEDIDTETDPETEIDAFDSALEDLAPPAPATPLVSSPSRQQPAVSAPRPSHSPAASTYSTPSPAPKPSIASPSVPPPDPKEKQADAWIKAFHDLFMTVNSVRDLGGLPKLTEGWKPQQKERAVRALSEVRDILNQYIKFFRGESE